MLINTKECICKKNTANKCSPNNCFWMKSCHLSKSSCSHSKCYHKNTSLTFSPGTGCALGSQIWPAGCQKLEDIKEEETSCTHPVSHRYPLLFTAERRWSCVDLCYGLEQLLLYSYVKWTVWESRSNLESKKESETIEVHNVRTNVSSSRQRTKAPEQKSLRRDHKETLN